MAKDNVTEKIKVNNFKNQNKYIKIKFRKYLKSALLLWFFIYFRYH